MVPSLSLRLDLCASLEIAPPPRFAHLPLLLTDDAKTSTGNRHVDVVDSMVFRSA